MLCQSCNKFAAFEIQEPEVEGLDIEGGHVAGTVRLHLTTECCGDEAKETIFEIDEDLSEDIIHELKEAGIAEPDLEMEGVELEVDGSNAWGEDRLETKDRKGKPIANARYMKKFYVANVSLEVTCKYPNPDPEAKEPVTVTLTHEWTDEIQASHMDEL